MLSLPLPRRYRLRAFATTVLGRSMSVMKEIGAMYREVRTLDKQTGYPFPSARADTCSCSPEHLESTVAPVEERSFRLSLSIQVYGGA